jgi:hypothetical protein
MVDRWIFIPLVPLDDGDPQLQKNKTMLYMNVSDYRVPRAPKIQ